VAGGRALWKSPNFTAAQRIRAKFMPRRPLKHGRELSTFQAILQVCMWADEVQTEMLNQDPPMDPHGLFFCGIVVKSRLMAGFDKVETYPITPDPDAMSRVRDELDKLDKPQPLGAIFRIVDTIGNQKIPRDWVRPFVGGKAAMKHLIEQREQQKQGTPGAGGN